MEKILIIGGGLGGLLHALCLARAGVPALVIEKKEYPFHRVCGEYVSNEVLPFLQALGVDPQPLAPAHISRFMLSAPSGKSLAVPLDLGGFGVSRYALDLFLYEAALARGVEFKLNTTVEDLRFADDTFTLTLSDGSLLVSKVVVGAYGKRTNLDRHLNRPFFKVRSPYVGIKYHLRADFPRDLVALHNFPGGYAGVSALEEGKTNLCYLINRRNLKISGGIPQMEERFLHRNPHLRQLFREADFLYEQPEVINEISFATKSCVENHVLMCGDAAGMIAPLCGNGMAMAMHAAKLLADHVVPYAQGKRSRQEMENGYRRDWRRHFARRLQVGRTVQKMFGAPVLSEVVVGAARLVPASIKKLMRFTHGKPFA